MILTRLLRTVSFSHLKTEKVKGFLTILGMTLGIAVFAGIRFASQNVFESFEMSTRILAGPQSRMIVSASGRMDESYLTLIYGLKNVKALIPLSRRIVEIRQEGQALGKAQVIGLDVLRMDAFGSPAPDTDKNLQRQFIKLLQPGNAAALSSSLAQSLSGPLFQTVADTEEVTLENAFTLPQQGLAESYGGRVIVMDIASYQEMFKDFGKIDRVLVLGGAGFDDALFSGEIQAIGHGALSYITGKDQNREGRKMTEAFNLNLQFLACISLFVAVLLIYNSVSYAVLKRRRETGTLLSMGVQPRTLFSLLMLESLSAGLIAALIGTLAGYALSFINVRLMTASISSLYFPVEIAHVVFKPRVLFECLLLGPLLAAAGCILPCLEIFKVAPRETFHYQNFEEKFKRRLPHLSLAGFALLGAGLLCSNIRLLQISIFLGFIPPMLFILGFVLLLPLFLSGLVKTGKLLFKKTGSLASFLALDHIESTLQRNAVAVASAMIAIGMFLGMSTMILSFRGTVEQWIEHVTKADLFISSPYPISGYEGGFLPDSLTEALTGHSEILAYDWISSKQIKINGRSVKVNGVRFKTLKNYDRLLLETPMTAGELTQAVKDEHTVFVSETFSNRFGYKQGDTLELYGLLGKQKFFIANVFYDYSSDQGVILMHDTAFESLYDEPRKQGMALYLFDPAQAETVRDWILDEFSGHELLVRENKNLRQEVMNIFDQTFRITHALQWIALLIAAFTILNTILMLKLERAREFGVLRALGAGSGLLIKMMVYEALLLAGAAVLGGIIVGFVLALILVFVINKFFFAWSVVFCYSWTTVFSTALGALFLALLAGLIPAMFFVRKIDARMLRYE